jgi:hypothetical protein
VIAVSNVNTSRVFIAVVTRAAANQRARPFILVSGVVPAPDLLLFAKHLFAEARRLLGGSLIMRSARGGARHLATPRREPVGGAWRQNCCCAGAGAGGAAAVRQRGATDMAFLSVSPEAGPHQGGASGPSAEPCRSSWHCRQLHDGIIAQRRDSCPRGTEKLRASQGPAVAAASPARCRSC